MINKHDTYVHSQFINLREVEPSDAKFILSLRCDEKKARFLNKTENNLQKQIDYINHYKTLTDEWYFIIEDKQNNPIGTYRIYDLRKDSFCIGSWIMLDSVTPEQVVQADYLMRSFGFKETGFDKIHFDVRKENKKVLRYHKLMGAKIVAEGEIDYFFECTKKDYLDNVKSFIN